MENIDMLLEPVRASLHQIGAFLPRAAARAGDPARRLAAREGGPLRVVKALRALNFHVVTEKAGIDGFLQQGGGEIDTTGVLGLLVYWLVILAALMVAFNSLGLDLRDRPARPGGAVRAEGDGGGADPRLRRLLRALRRRRGDDLLPQRRHRRRRAAGPARAVRDHGLRGADRARPARPRRHHPADLPDHRRRGGAGRALAFALAFGLGGQRRAAELLERWRRPAEGPADADRRPPAL